MGLCGYKNKIYWGDRKMEEVNLKQFLIEIGIRQEAAELIDLAFIHPE